MQARGRRAGDPQPDRRRCSSARRETTPLSLFERESADHRRAQRAVRPRAARSAAARPGDLRHPGQPLRPGLRRARTASSRRPTSCSRTTAPAADHRAHRQLGRPAHRRIEPDGRRPPADGSRVNAIIPPLALDGPVLSIRRFRTDRLGAQDLVERESLTQPMLDFLQAAVACRLNIIVSGGTGAGKTTLLNVLSGFISRQRAHRHDRGRRRTDAAAAARRPPRNAAGQHRRQGRGPAARAGRSTPCVCVPIASSSARSAARKRSTCCRR